MGEKSDGARAAWLTRAKTELCACAHASLRLRPGTSLQLLSFQDTRIAMYY